VATSASAAPSGPFAGTPAEDYPAGAAGITLPPAKAVPGFSAVQVQAALTTLRSALIAGRLDHAMLVGHDTSALFDLLSMSSRNEMARWAQSGDLGAVATWIDPAVRLNDREQPRVSGRVTYSSVVVSKVRTLRVTTNFIWVYAFDGGGAQPIAAIHDETAWDFPEASVVNPADRGMRVAKVNYYMTWVDCAASAKGLLAPTKDDDTGSPAEPAPSESAGDYLRADHSLTVPDNCPAH
jgi:hypothetical protein